MSILFKFFGAFFIFLFLGGGLSYIIGKELEDTDGLVTWALSVLIYTLLIMIIMGHYGCFNQ